MLIVRDDGWCQGVNLKGQVGYFPAQYVQRVESADHPAGVPAPRLIGATCSETSGYGFAIVGNGPVRVDSIAPTHRCGVLAGDVVLEINGEPCADWRRDALYCV